MYSDEEILEHLTEGEGRGFLGRSMYDAIMEKIKQQENQLQQKDKEIERLQSIIKEVREYIYNNSFDEERKEIIDELWVNEIKDILDILDKVSDKE